MATPPAKGKSVTVTCSTEITDDVLAGIRVYSGIMQQPVSDQALRDRWLRWNRDNPYGPGLYVVAKDGPKAVGMYAVIPMRMRVAGETITGGKGEYQAVLPDYLRAVDAETGGYLPTAMCQRAYTQAADNGMRAIQAFPTEVARFSVFRAGGRPVTIAGKNYMAFLRSCRLERDGKSKIDPRLITLGGTLATLGLRATGILTNRSNLTVGFGEPPLALDPPASANQFLAEEMLPFRYPASDYQTVTVKSTSGTAQLTFTTPHPASIVRVSHWSPYVLDAAQWTAGLNAIFKIARQCGAGAINIRIPNSAPTDPALFRSLGFLARPFEYTMFVYSREPELMARLTDNPWAPTNSHFGLYTYS